MTEISSYMPRFPGAQALTLREIARRAGVSHGAPRRHSRTQPELLSTRDPGGHRPYAGNAAPGRAG
ncbi:hypothetical protein [Streptomyces griseoviridis]|uniref:hypothetical protein n=1 Tax=Streptomyces griseoviridis TaxID=45398 RepID=UPI003F53EA8E